MRVYKARCGLVAIILDDFKGLIIKDNKPIFTSWNDNLCNQNADWDLMEQLRNQDGLYG